MEKPLLTVAIPTYNRPEPLQKTLETFKKEGYTKEFQILVSDDSSEDGVEKIVRLYQQDMPNLIYHRNPKNLGFSGNVCQLYEMAITRYVWFLCDDDSVLTGAISGIIHKLKELEPVVAIFNYSWDDPYGRHMSAGVIHDQIYTDLDAFADYNILLRLTFLSIIIVEKRLSIEEIINHPDYKDNVFVQLTISLLLLSDKFRLCEIATPILHRNVGFKYGEFFKFLLVDTLKAVYLVSHKFDNQKFVKWSKKYLPTNAALYMSQKIGLYRYVGEPTEATIKLIEKYYGKHYWTLVRIFRTVNGIIPSKIVRFIYLIRLFWIHGFRKGLMVYKKQVDRAYKDERKTAFTSYR